LCLVALCGFVALAVDVGMVAVARTQAQLAADAAALAAARSIDGSPSPNLGQATVNAQNAGAATPVLAKPLAASEMSVQHGTYHYDYGSQTFSPQFAFSA